MSFVRILVYQRFNRFDTIFSVPQAVVRNDEVWTDLGVAEHLKNLGFVGSLEHPASGFLEPQTQRRPRELVVFNTKEVHEINIFAAVLVLESLPFLSAVGIAILENSRINAFSFWSKSRVRAAELIGLRREALPVPIANPQPVASEIMRDATASRPAE